jgi:hypothetical protein
MAEVIYRFAPEVYELQSYVDFPSLDLAMTRVQLLPSGLLEIHYDLTAALKATLEVQRRLRSDGQTQE